MSNLIDKEAFGLKSKKNIDFLTSLNKITNKLKSLEYDFQILRVPLSIIYNAEFELSEKNVFDAP